MESSVVAKNLYVAYREFVLFSNSPMICDADYQHLNTLEHSLALAFEEYVKVKIASGYHFDELFLGLLKDDKINIDKFFI